MPSAPAIREVAVPSTSVLAIRFIITAAAVSAFSLGVESRAQVPDKSALAGSWTLNPQLSDRPAARDDRGDQTDRSGRRGYGGGGGRRGGGFGRGGYGGGRPGGGADPQEMARTREALRDILTPPDRLTITQTESMIIITGADGRTVRLSPDGKKIKDENTNAERKTHWEAGMLVSEIGGLGPKITQTFAVNASHQLRITVHAEGRGGNQGRSGQNPARDFTYVYDPETPQ